MATKVRIELNHAGIQELLCSAPIAAECEAAAHGIAARAGDGFEVLPARLNNFKGSPRVGYAVKAVTYEARVAEAEDKVLSTAVRG